MKKIILAGLLVLSMFAMAESGKDILRKAREDYYKQQKEMTKPVKEKKVPEKKKIEVSGEITDEIIIEEETVEEVKPKTPMEKLEYNAAKARDRVDFYERVVRSVEREEKELNGYNDVLGKNRKKKVVKNQQKKSSKNISSKKKN